jgi:hypothetical protein
MRMTVMGVATGREHAKEIDGEPNRRDEQELVRLHLGRVDASDGKGRGLEGEAAAKEGTESAKRFRYRVSKALSMRRTCAGPPRR